MTLVKFFDLLKQSNIPVWHYEAELEEPPYIVYQELSTTYDNASGRPFEEYIRLEVVHFTKDGLCPSLKRLKDLLFENKIGFSIAHGYDKATKTIINQLEITIRRRLDHD